MIPIQNTIDDLDPLPKLTGDTSRIFSALSYETDDGEWTDLPASFRHVFHSSPDDKDEFYRDKTRGEHWWVNGKNQLAYRPPVPPTRLDDALAGLGVALAKSERACVSEIDIPLPFSVSQAGVV